MSLEKRILVTGGTKGLGLAIARQLASRGFEVICVARKNSDELQQLMLKKQSLSFFALDVGDIENLQNNIKLILKETGPIWGLVNNAALGRDGVLATMHEKDLKQMIDVNLTGAILITKYVVRSMLKCGSGSIVNISSIIASTGFNGLSAYAATKAAMIGFTKSLARELGRAKIRVNCVSPGYMETEMTAGLDDEKLATITRRSPLGRLPNTDEVAAMVSFLMSEEASAITGANMIVDAGSTA
jgi:3-oxoacyl-[acyl-carrier protein] reductase